MVRILVGVFRRLFFRPNVGTHLFVQLAPIPVEPGRALSEAEQREMAAWLREEGRSFGCWVGVKPVMDIVQGRDSVFVLLASLKFEELQMCQAVVSIRCLCEIRGAESVWENQQFNDRCRWVWPLDRLR